MTIADGSDVLASDILAIKQNAQTAFDMAQNALSDATDALAAATAALAAAEGAYPATGGVIDGIVTIGAGAKNALTITPGAAAASPVVLAQSGTGGITLPTLTSITSNGILTLSNVSAVHDIEGSFVVKGSSYFGNISGPIGQDLFGSYPASFTTLGASTITAGSGTQNKLTITPGAAAANPITLAQSGSGGLTLPAISAPLMELLDSATAIRVGAYLDQNDAFNVGAPASGTTIASRFTINATGSPTADTGNIATAATITPGSPLQAGTITSDNTGMIAAQSIILTSPMPVTVGGAITLIWFTGTGSFTANVVVKTSVVSGTTRTIGAVGTVSGSPLTANGVTFTATYSQPGGAGTAISVSYNVVTNYSGAPWLMVGPTAIKIGSGAQNALTITPGSSASSAITIQQSGSGGISLPTTSLSIGLNLTVSGTITSTGQITAQSSLLVGLSGSQNTLTVTPGATISSPIVMAKSGSAGLTLPQLTGLTVGTSANSRLTITPGATSSDPVVMSTSGLGGLTLPPTVIQQSMALGTGTNNILNISSGLTSVDHIVLSRSGTGGFQIGSTVGFNGTVPIAKPTGWGVPTGTATRTTFDTATVTLSQLAEHVKALIDNLTSYGLIGP